MMTSPDTLAQTPVEIALSYNLSLGLKPLSSSEALIPKFQAVGHSGDHEHTRPAQFPRPGKTWPYDVGGTAIVSLLSFLDVRLVPRIGIKQFKYRLEVAQADNEDHRHNQRSIRVGETWNLERRPFLRTRTSP